MALQPPLGCVVSPRLNNNSGEIKASSLLQALRLTGNDARCKGSTVNRKFLLTACRNSVLLTVGSRLTLRDVATARLAVHTQCVSHRYLPLLAGHASGSTVSCNLVVCMAVMEAVPPLTRPPNTQKLPSMRVGSRQGRRQSSWSLTDENKCGCACNELGH